MKPYLKINSRDLVAVALRSLDAGTAVETGGREIILREDIPQGHKFTLTDIPAGTPVIKYGAPIGIAQADIPAGGWAHTHNLKTGLGELLDYKYAPSGTPLAPTNDCCFQGYRREDGRAAVRNEIWIIPTVGPFASPVPTVKIASNSQLAEKKKNWIDFNCGALTEDVSLEELSKRLFDLVIETASGREVQSEQAGFHDMAIFKQGVTL